MTKLTISIDERIREAAKAYARRNNTSVSKLIEDFLLRLMAQEHRPYSDRVFELLGYASLEEPPSDVRSEKLAYLQDKHLDK